VNETEELLNVLFEAVVSGNIQKAKETAGKAVCQGVSADAALKKMTEAMHVVDRKYERKEYFIVDVASSASAMREAFKIVQPHLQVKSIDIAGKIVMGSLKGNLGVDVSPGAFVDAVIQEEPQIVGISVSVDETVPFLKGVVDRLQQENLRNRVKIVIGGPAVSEKIRKKYGADAYAKDAWDCVRKARNLIDELKKDMVLRSD